MRSVITKVVLASGVLLLFAGGTAQASMSTVVRANVPFAFTANGKNFPAGEYRIERDDMSPSILLIRGEGRNHAHTLASTRPDGGQDPAGSTPARSSNPRSSAR